MISKLRIDADLRYCYTGEQKPKGAPRKYDGKVDLSDLTRLEFGCELANGTKLYILTLDPDNFLVLKDIGSSNGTMVDSKEIAIEADISITDRRLLHLTLTPAVGTIRRDPTANEAGDKITLGHWTRIKLIN